MHPLSLSQIVNKKAEVKILSPRNGDFVLSPIVLSLESSQKINILKVYLNNRLISTFNDISAGIRNLQLEVESLALQNKLVIEGVFSNAESFRKELIIFKKVSND